MNETAQLAKLLKWLRKRLRLEMLQQACLALGTSVLALAVLGAMALVLSGLILAGTASSEREALLSHYPLFALSFLALFLGAALLAFRIRQKLDYGSNKYALPRHLDRHFFDAASDLGGDIFMAAPQLLVRASECLAKISRLGRIDKAQAASIIFWLWQTGHKASAEEISAKFPDVNVVAVLPQFRDIPGIIWLLPRRGVILLSKELRDELSDLLGKPRVARPAPEPEPEPEPRPRYTYSSQPPPNEPPPERPHYRPELLQWYETLGLPAFATIQDVKKRYRQLAKKHHPDAVAGRGGLRTIQSEEAMKRINFAYHEILKSANHG